LSAGTGELVRTVLFENGIAALVAVSALGVSVVVIRLVAKVAVRHVVGPSWIALVESKRRTLQARIEAELGPDFAYDDAAHIVDLEMARLERALDGLRRGIGASYIELGFGPNFVLQVVGQKTREHAIDALATDTAPLLSDYYAAAARSNEPNLRQAGAMFKRLQGGAGTSGRLQADVVKRGPPAQPVPSERA
jgi:hypothetical protein